jgi:hypothetical protein
VQQLQDCRIAALLRRHPQTHEHITGTVPHLKNYKLLIQDLNVSIDNRSKVFPNSNIMVRFTNVLMFLRASASRSDRCRYCFTVGAAMGVDTSRYTRQLCFLVIKMNERVVSTAELQELEQQCGVRLVFPCMNC